MIEVYCMLARILSYVDLLEVKQSHYPTTHYIYSTCNSNVVLTPQAKMDEILACRVLI